MLQKGNVDPTGSMSGNEMCARLWSTTLSCVFHVAVWDPNKFAIVQPLLLSKHIFADFYISEIYQIVIVKGSCASTPGSFLNRCFNVTWLLSSNASFSQRFITCHWWHMLGCCASFLQIFLTTFNNNNHHIKLSTNMREHDMVTWHSHKPCWVLLQL